jgi:curli biogenesis system outer membrane secretion channel CsgG
MKKLSLILLAMLAISSITGCATTPQQPIVTSEQADVAVSQQCTVAYPTPPQNYFAGLTASDSILTKGNAALAELDAYKTYSAELLAALTKCAVNSNATTTTSTNSTK